MLHKFFIKKYDNEQQKKNIHETEILIRKTMCK